MSDHFVVATAKHFLGRRIHRADNAGIIDRDHAVEDVLDYGTNMGLGAFELGKLSANQNKTVTIRNDQ